MIWLNRSVTELKLAMTLGQREQDRELTFMKNEPEPRICTMNVPDVDLYLFQWDRAPESRRVSLN